MTTNQIIGRAIALCRNAHAACSVIDSREVADISGLSLPEARRWMEANRAAIVQAMHDAGREAVKARLQCRCDDRGRGQYHLPGCHLYVPMP